MLRVNLEDVKGAMEDGSVTCFVDVPDGIVIEEGDEEFFDENGLRSEFEEKNFIPIPDQSYFNEYQNMKDFADSQSGQPKEWLENALHGAGAFRRFRGALGRFNLEDDWYDWDDRAHLLSAAEWCEENGIAYDAGGNVNISAAMDSDEKKDSRSVKKVYRIAAVTEKNSGLLTDMAAALIQEMQRYDGKAGDLDMEAGVQLVEDQMNNGSQILMAMDQGRPAGFCIVENAGIHHFMRDLFIRKEYRRQGIGSLLAQKALEEHKDLLFLVQPGNQEGASFLSALGYSDVKYMIISGRNES